MHVGTSDGEPEAQWAGKPGWVVLVLALDAKSGAAAATMAQVMPAFSAVGCNQKCPRREQALKGPPAIALWNRSR